MQTSHYYALCRQVSTTTYSTTTCRQAIDEHDGRFYNIDITSGALNHPPHSTARRSSTRKCSKMLLCLIQPLHCWCECMTNAEVTAGCRLALSIYSNESSFSKSFSSSLLSLFSGSCRSLKKVKFFTDQVRPALGSVGCSFGFDCALDHYELSENPSNNPHVLMGIPWSTKPFYKSCFCWKHALELRNY